MRSLSACAVLLTLAACDTPGSSRPATIAPAEGETRYTADVPAGWVRNPGVKTGLEITRDGVELQRVFLDNAAAEHAFPKSKHAAPPGATPSELAELAIAELKALGTEIGVQVELVTNEPATLAGHKGFRLALKNRSSEGLEMRHFYAGCLHGKTYTSIWFYAPALHYFERDKHAFEATLAGLRAETSTSSR